MKLLSALTQLSLLSVLPSVIASPMYEERSVSKTFLNHTLFYPGANWTDPGVLYARTVELTGNVLLATWENYSPEPPLVYFPIYQSTDGGSSWKHISNVTDQVNGWGLRYQPFLYELPSAIGGFPAGTVLLAGNSIPTNLSNTQIDLYASRDRGYTWEFVSHVAAGGEAVPDNGLTPVWEPFLLYYKNQLIVYYSDQRDPAYGQKLVHQTSHDLKTWAEPVDDVAYPTYTDRPGMTTVSQLPNGSYFMTYEYGGGPGFSSYSFPVYYRINDNPLKFNESIGHPINASGSVPLGSPYNVWTPVGGRDGTLVVSSGCCTQLWTNSKLGDPTAWEVAATDVQVAYTRSLRVLNENKDHLLVAGGGVLPPSTSNYVTVSVLSVEGLLEEE